MKFKDLTGQRFGRLVARAAHERTGRGWRWLCDCDCGQTKVTLGALLSSGETISCGCASRERIARLGADPTTIAQRSQKRIRHGHGRVGRRSDEYKTWLRIKSRCQRPSDRQYPMWGGRGIRVCERWDSSFEAFLSDMGPRPQGDYGIDRIDPDGDYEPENCRWVTNSENSSTHKRSLIPVTVAGVVYPSIAAACRATGVGYSAAMMRIAKGVDPVLAVTTREILQVVVRTRDSYVPANKRTT